MFLLATPIVDWSAMWKICVATFAAATLVVIAFGFVLLGLKIADHAKNNPGSRLGGLTLAIVCGIFCVGVVILGVYAMAEKPSSKPAKAKSALVTPAGPQTRLLASSR
jgi:NhaP-type Na+/H+ or K+/H+ antiporter